MPQKVKKKGRERKEPFCDRLEYLLQNYPAVFVVLCNNIGSSHMQKIKKSLRDKAIIVKGKNTLIRKAIRRRSDTHPQWGSLLPYIRGNVGLVFAQSDLKEVKDALLNLRVSAPAKIGTLAPQDVWIEKGGTGLEPTKTSFLQALNIASKINRGQIEILQDVLLIKKETKVGTSEATLLQMLGKKPFSYGLICNYVYEDGKVYSAKFIDIEPSTVMQRFAAGISTVAAISLSIGIPTLASVPHSILNAYKNLLSITLETDYMFDQAKKVKEIVENPEAFQATQPTTTTTTTTTENKPSKKNEPEEEPEEKKEEKEESDDMGIGLFGDDS
jgi:large subunit ribosomal protein LP0